VVPKNEMEGRAGAMLGSQGVIEQYESEDKLMISSDKLFLFL